MQLEVALTWSAMLVSVVAVVVVAPTTSTAILGVVAVVVVVALTKDLWRRTYWWQQEIPIAKGAWPLIGHMLEDLNFGCLRFLKCHEVSKLHNV